MKQKISSHLIIISILAVFITAISVTLVYYSLFKEQVRKDLKLEAKLLSEAGISELVKNEEVKGDKELRITWISASGEVLFDNDASNLGNHLDRPEVKDALKKGYGESERESDTMKLRTFYYAILLNDGTVLRVAKEASSIANVFIAALAIIIAVVVIIIVICVLLSRILAKQLLAPIEAMTENLDNVSTSIAYEEMEPFVTRIREQHKEILAAAKSRQDFTANVSHELKTPITAISGYAELIENKMVSEDQSVRFAGEIRNQSERLVSLVNDIIKLSELDHSESVVEFTRIELLEIAEERIEFLQNMASNKGVSLTLEGEQCYVMSSKGLMVELIDNLVQNAIRYNKPGGKVDVKIQNTNNRVSLIVQDTGIGIPKEAKDRVFERFYRVDKGRSRETGGTGLGLAIVKHIVELHDGEIELISEVDVGTTITVML